MKKFFHDYSYGIIKMFVNQFAISIFGMSLALATTSAGNDMFTLIVSILSVMFYLFLIYSLSWEVGAKDKISVDVGKKPYRPHLGLLLSFIANIPNLILAALYAFATIFAKDGNWMSSMQVVVRLIMYLFEGMYLGMITAITLPIGGAYVQLNSLWPTYFMLVIPAMLISWLAYFLGHRNFRFFAFLGPKNAKIEKNNIKK